MSRAALLVCTRGRRELLTRWLESAAPIASCADPATTIIVADNNDEPDEAWIRAQARRFGYDIAYTHCGKPGYCYVRNAALDRALTTGAEIFIFVDDDDLLRADFVSKHIEAMTRHSADIVAGATGDKAGKQKEGRRVRKGFTNNLSVRRRVVEKHGLNIRFDPRCNLTGREDIEFVRDAVSAGAVAVRSHLPQLDHITSPRPFWGESPQAEVQNNTYVCRVRHGMGEAVFLYLRMYCPRLIGGAVLLCFGKLTGNAAMKQQGVQNLEAHRYALRGLYRPGLSRIALKRGELVEITEPMSK